jgi:hypothetical protein
MYIAIFGLEYRPATESCEKYTENFCAIIISRKIIAKLVDLPVNIIRSIESILV